MLLWLKQIAAEVDRELQFSYCKVIPSSSGLPTMNGNCDMPLQAAPKSPFMLTAITAPKKSG